MLKNIGQSHHGRALAAAKVIGAGLERIVETETLNKVREVNCLAGFAASDVCRKSWLRCDGNTDTSVELTVIFWLCLCTCTHDQLS